MVVFVVGGGGGDCGDGGVGGGREHAMVARLRGFTVEQQACLHPIEAERHRPSS